MVKSLFHGLLYGMQFTITNFWLLMIFPKFMFLVGFSNRPYILSGMSRCYINLPSTLFSYILQSLSPCLARRLRRIIAPHKRYTITLILLGVDFQRPLSLDRSCSVEDAPVSRALGPAV